MKYTTFVSTLAALCTCAALVAGPAHAQETTSAPKQERDVKGIYGGVGGGLGIFEHPDDEEDAIRLQAWFRPANWMSFELGYIDAGDPGKHVEDVDGLHVALVPTLALLDSGIDLFGKVGGFFWDDDNVAVGLGAAYHLPWNLGLRVDWDLLNADDSDSINVVTLSVFYHLSKMGK